MSCSNASPLGDHADRPTDPLCCSSGPVPFPLCLVTEPRNRTWRRPDTPTPDVCLELGDILALLYAPAGLSCHLLEAGEKTTAARVAGAVKRIVERTGYQITDHAIAVAADAPWSMPLSALRPPPLRSNTALRRS